MYKYFLSYCYKGSRCSGFGNFEASLKLEITSMEVVKSTEDILRDHIVRMSPELHEDLNLKITIMSFQRMN